MSRYTCFSCKAEHGEDNMIAYCAACYAKTAERASKSPTAPLWARVDGGKDWAIRVQIRRPDGRMIRQDWLIDGLLVRTSARPEKLLADDTERVL